MPRILYFGLMENAGDQKSIERQEVESDDLLERAFRILEEGNSSESAIRIEQS